jgi:hypothetical protein
MEEFIVIFSRLHELPERATAELVREQSRQRLTGRGERSKH